MTCVLILLEGKWILFPFEKRKKIRSKSACNELMGLQLSKNPRFVIEGLKNNRKKMCQRKTELFKKNLGSFLGEQG